METAEPASEGAEEPWPWWAWALVLLLYIALGYRFRSVFLNWIVGPLFPLFVLYVIPNWLRPKREGGNA